MVCACACVGVSVSEQVLTSSVGAHTVSCLFLHTLSLSVSLSLNPCPHRQRKGRCDSVVGSCGALWGGACISRERELYTHELVMTHIAPMNESWHAYERVSHVTHMNE